MIFKLDSQNWPYGIYKHCRESHGVRMISVKEMDTQDEPIWVDLNGGMDRLPDLADFTSCICSKLNKKADLRRAIARDNSASFK
jgi:fatty acid synthase subunit alpha